ncbi:MAG TPA: hypothetical protein VF307_00815 [Candidatus Nanopelagicaceae bacterium]
MKKLTAVLLAAVFLTVLSAAPSGAAVKSTASIGGPWCCYL